MSLDFNLFGWPLIALLTVTPSLGLLGAQVMGRQQALQVLCIAQGAILGHILSLWWSFDSPWILAWAVALVVSWACERFNKMPMASRNSFHVSLYVVLLSLTYLLVSLVPAVESHALNQFFGDVVLVSTQGAQWLFALGLILLGVLLFFFNSLTHLSFEIMVLGMKPNTSKKIWLNRGFKLVMTLFLTLVIQYLGLLYALGALTVIPLVLAQQKISLSAYMRSIVFVSVAGSFFGFLAALQIHDASTTPVINLSFLLFALALRFSFSLIRKYR